MPNTIRLYDFQSVCVDKLGVPELVSRLIGDEMGLGKTVEALAIDSRLRIKTGSRFKSPGMRSKPTLIVAPHGVHASWARHIGKMFPSAAYYIIDRKNRLSFVKAAQSGKYDYLICHYEALRLMPELRKVTWFHIICDEVHRIKNRKAQQTRAVKALDTRFKSGLSGTPADNKPQDLWSVLNWLYPKKYTSYWRYVNTYLEQTETTGKNGATFKQVVGVNKDTIPQLLSQMEPWYIRRLKEKVLPDLPDKYYSTREVELLPSQRKAYNQMRKDMVAWVGEHEDEPLVAPVVIAQLIRLQQFAMASPAFVQEYGNTSFVMADGEPFRKIRPKVVLQEPSSKLDDLCEFFEDIEFEPIVVFSQSKSMIDLVEARLTRMKKRVGKYTGSVSKKQRDLNVDRFQGGDLDVFAGTIAAGGEGIELTRSSNVVFLDRHWSPSKNRQAEDRLHRIGQKSAVQVTDIIAANTVDLGRNQQIAAKWSTLKMLLGDTVNVEGYVDQLQNEGLATQAVQDALTIFRGGTRG